MRTDLLLDLKCEPRRIPADIRLPYPDYLPTKLLEAKICLRIAGTIALDFCHPVSCVRTSFESTAPLRPVAAMPKVPVTEHHDVSTRKDDIRSAGETTVVEPVAESTTPECAPQ
jgi:hypothetical protein